jgi:hypothetical protein
MARLWPGAAISRVVRGVWEPGRIGAVRVPATRNRDFPRRAINLSAVEKTARRQSPWIPLRLLCLVKWLGLCLNAPRAVAREVGVGRMPSNRELYSAVLDKIQGAHAAGNLFGAACLGLLAIPSMVAYESNSDFVVKWVIFLFCLFPPLLLIGTLRWFPRQRSVLWLRRFHRERLPQFPLSKVFNRLSAWGLQTYTLRDSRVKGSKGIGAKLSYVVPTIFMPLVGCGFWAVAQTIPFDGPIAHWMRINLGLFGLWFFLILLVACCFLPAILICLGISRLLGMLSVPANESGLRRHFSKIGRHLTQLDITVIATDDDRWQQTVEFLVESVDFVVVDLSDISENVVWEIQAIRRLGRANTTIWMVCDENSAKRIRVASSGGFSVLGVDFDGVPRILRYPQRGERSEYATSLRLDLPIVGRPRELAFAILEQFSSLPDRRA